jgi:hypothetical protein
MKYVFISLPMSGKTTIEIANRLKSINSIVKEKVHVKFGWDIKDIQTIDNFWDFVIMNDEKQQLSTYDSISRLPNAMYKLAEADAVYFDEEWGKDKECIIESMVVNMYKIPVIFYDEAIDICEKEEKEDEE